jgi:coat protein Gp5
MANTILTPTMVTREALRVLHQKLNFIGSINRQYDDQFAKTGAKIGTQLKIRLPNQYTVRSGATLSTQDTTENSVTLNLTTQKGVDLNFTSVDLTLSLDDFSKRILNPAMAVLAANIESDALSMLGSVYNQVNNQGSAITLNQVLLGRKTLRDNLAPDGNWSALLCTQDNVDLVNALKGLFQDSGEIAEQYREGYMGRTAGFEFMENTLLQKQASGTEVALPASTMVVNGAGQTGSSVTVTNPSAKTLAAGDIIAFAGCNRCHPETKADTGALQQFVVTSAVGTGGTSIPISPAIVTSGPTQNVIASPTTGVIIQKIGTAGTSYGISAVYHEDAFTFATADLIMPKGVDFAAREVLDGISMRIVRQYDIVNDKFPCRIDVAYGYLPMRPQLACRLANN